MENLNLKGTFKFPTLNFNGETGILEIKGRSLPEHAIEFYAPVLEWMDKYKKSPKSKTTVNVSLEYFNTSSSKLILDIFRRLKELHAGGNELVVNWYYEEDDPDIQEQGEIFRDLVKVPINMIPVKEFDFSFN